MSNVSEDQIISINCQFDIDKSKNHEKNVTFLGSNFSSPVKPKRSKNTLKEEK